MWSSTDDNGDPLEDNYDWADLSDVALSQIIKDCADFQDKARDLICDENLLRKPDDDTYGTFGHDFWLTRNGHGAGFWDGDYAEPAAEQLTKLSESYGECSLYVGDDGRLYIS